MTDIARMERHHINLETGWMDYPRGKTEVKRRAKLWDETCEAIREAMGVQNRRTLWQESFGSESVS